MADNSRIKTPTPNTDEAEDKDDLNEAVNDEDDQDDSSENSSEDDEDNSETESSSDAEESGERAIAGVAHSLNNVKEAMQTAIKALKGFIKIFVKLLEAGPVGWIVLAVLVVFLILMILVFSFRDENNGNEKAYRSLYDTQDLRATSEYENTKEYKELLKETQNQVKDDLGKEEYEKLKDQINEYSMMVNDYEDNTVSMYDTKAGYQILNTDGTFLKILEQLSYAFKYPEWEPEYDNGGTLAAKIETLEAEIAEQEALSKKDRKWSELKLRNKKEELVDLKEDYENLKEDNLRYIELNTLIKDKIEKEFVESEREATVHPDGNPIVSEPLEYFKDINGVLLEEGSEYFNEVKEYFTSRWDIELNTIKEELNYFHELIYRKFTWTKTKQVKSLDAVMEFLDDPELEDADRTEEDEGISLGTDVEFPFRARFELMHHEITYDLINHDNILNTLFTQPETMYKLKRCLGRHIPLFEYITYHKDVIDKTFYEYELYKPSKYSDENGDYIFDGNFEELVRHYVQNEETDIDFSKVQLQADREYQLELYKTQLAEQEASENPDKILIVELNQEIARLEEEIAANPPSNEMKDAYSEKYKKYMKDSVDLTEETRPYDAYNHNILVDKLETTDDGKEDYAYYINYSDVPVDGYNESITLKITKIKNADGDGDRGTEGAWEEVDSGPSSVSETTYDISLETKATQSSLKPLKIRSVLNSADYTYEKVIQRKTKAEIEKLIAEAEKTAKWQRRKVPYTKMDKKTGKSSSKDYYDYKQEFEVKFSNTGLVDSAVAPWETNEDLYLDSSTYLTDFYGQTERMVTNNYEGSSPGNTTPGTGGIKVDLKDVTITPGSCSLPYYYQYKYSGNYGEETIKSSACGPTSLAMIFDGLTGENKGVEWMCNFAVENGYYAKGSGSYRSLFTTGAEKLGLHSHTINYDDPQGIADALGRNHPVAMICGPGDFTNSGHFIVLTGIDENGMVSVHDPNSEGRSGKKWPLAQIISNASTSHGKGTFWEIYK